MTARKAMTTAQTGEKKDTANDSYYTQHEPPLPSPSTRAENPVAGEQVPVCSKGRRGIWKGLSETVLPTGIQVSFTKGDPFPTHTKSDSRHCDSHCINRTYVKEYPKTGFQAPLLLMLEHNDNVPLPRKLVFSAIAALFSWKGEDRQ